MSPRSRPLPRRSCHSVPAANDRFLQRAPGLGADMVFLDLEDGVATARKAEARAAAADAVRTADWGDTVICVRVNSWSSPWTVFDLLGIVEDAGPRLDAVMLPKVESAAQVVAADLVIGQAERRAGRPAGHIGLELQIETVAGLAAVEEICAASPRTEGVAFGPGDFAASIGMPALTTGVAAPEYPGDQFHYALTRILVAARANRLHVVDGPLLQIDDLTGLRASAERVRALGLDGKWTIHPDQIPVVNEVFTPRRADLDRALAVIEAHRSAAAGGVGATRLDDEVIDEVSRTMAERLVERGRRCGLIGDDPAP